MVVHTEIADRESIYTGTLARLLAAAAMVTVTVAIWVLAKPYRGLDHDAALYSLQVLARIHPESLSNDLFLRYESQDNYTLFTPFFVWWVRLLGLNAAAALLTCVFQAIFCLAAGLVAAQIMGRKLAWLAAALALIVPNFYGGFKIFEVVEPFVTPRLLAESLVLLALAARLAGRPLLAYGTVATSALVHPLMSFPGLLALIWADLPPRVGRWCMAMACVTLVAATFLALFHPIGSVRLLDKDWLELVSARNLYFFIDRWPIADWQRMAAQLFIPGFALTLLHAGYAKRLLGAFVVLAAVGLILTAYTSFGPKIQLLLAGQPWRWVWLAAVSSVLLIPWISSVLWPQGPIGRSCALMLIVAGFCPGQAGALAPLAFLLFVKRQRLSSEATRVIYIGSIAIAAIIAAWTLANIATLLTLNFSNGRLPFIVERLRNIFDLGIPAIAMLWICWQLAINRPSKNSSVWVAAAIVTVSGATALGTVLPSWRYWIDNPPEYSAENYRRFKVWRDVIPPRAEVFWNANALPVWWFLERSSYLSFSQSAGIIFSRATAMEIARRAAIIDPLIKKDYMLAESEDEDSIRPLTADILKQICRDPALGFVVGEAGAGNGIPMPLSQPSWKVLELYDCDSVRS